MAGFKFGTGKEQGELAQPVQKARKYSETVGDMSQGHYRQL